MAKLFVSYRRGLDWASAPEIMRALRAALPGADIFRDLESISPGVDFEQAINRQIPQLDLMLVIISPYWTQVLKTRADQAADPASKVEKDTVAMEIAAAIAHGKRLLPVLVAGAEMPTALELPAALAPLSKANAVTLDLLDAEASAARLSEAVKVALEEERERRIREARVASIRDFRPFGAELLASPRLDLHVKELTEHNMFVTLPASPHNLPRLLARFFLTAMMVAAVMLSTFLFTGVMSYFAVNNANKAATGAEIDGAALLASAAALFTERVPDFLWLPIATAPPLIFFAFCAMFALGLVPLVRTEGLFNFEDSIFYVPVDPDSRRLILSRQKKWSPRLLRSFWLAPFRVRAISPKRSEIQATRQPEGWVAEFRMAVDKGEVFVFSRSRPQASRDEAILAVGEFAYALLRKMGFAEEEMPPLDLSEKAKDRG